MLVTRGIGSPGGLIPTVGLGRIITAAEVAGIGGGMRYQVVRPRIHPIPSEPRIAAFVKKFGKPYVSKDEIEIKIASAVYPVAFEAIPNVGAAMRADAGIREKIQRAAVELGVSRRRARSALRHRVSLELKGIRALRKIFDDDDDIIWILILAGII